MDPYIIVTAISSNFDECVATLACRVNKHKKNGYKCAGGINIISSTIYPNTYYKFAQAMEKDEK